jgi:mannan endo-1,4-beta-mannosidase
MNEPRCRGCGARLQAWIREMAEHVALHDPHHLRTVGEEGFYSSWRSRANPAAWASSTGQDFVTNHDLRSIDFTSMHLWPSNWALLGGASAVTVRVSWQLKLCACCLCMLLVHAA